MYYYDRDMIGNEDGEGVCLHVPAGHLQGKPRWRLHAARERTTRDAILSVTLGDDTLAWIRIDSWWDEMYLLKAAPGSPSPSPLPSITSPQIERVRREVSSSLEPAPRAWRMAWTRFFAQQFGVARYHMLWEGRWLLTPTTDYNGQLARQGVSQLAQYIEELAAPCFEVFNREMPWPWPLRMSSDPESARVSWWRKVARRGDLPPVVCMRVDPLLADVIIDGHDRMLAALLEGKDPDIIRLESISQRVLSEAQRREAQERVDLEFGYMRGHTLTPSTIDGLNRRARYAYGDALYHCATRAWPLQGGIPRWEIEVYGRGLELPPEHMEIIAAMLHEDVVEELVYGGEASE